MKHALPDLGPTNALILPTDAETTLPNGLVVIAIRAQRQQPLLQAIPLQDSPPR